MQPSIFSHLRDGFAWMIDGLRLQVAVRGAGRNPLPTPLVLATYSWLGRSLRRLAAIIARCEAGHVAAKRPARITRRSPAAAPPPHARLPGGQGWLLPLMPMHAPLAGEQLRHLLAQPQAAALIAGAPGFGRVLRPLARMLGVTLPPLLQPSARAPRRRSPKPQPAPRSCPIAAAQHHPPLRRRGFRPA